MAVTPQDLFDITKEALLLVAVISLPIVGATLAAAVLSGIVQAISKVSDPAVSTLPRIVLGVIALAATAPWIGTRAAAFAERAWSLLQAIHS